MAKNNITLGSGKVKLARIDSVSKEPGVFRYVGRSRELNLSVTIEEVLHYSSDSKTRELDLRVQTSVDRSGTMLLEDINKHNLAMFFLGESSRIAARAADDTAGTANTWILKGAQFKEIMREGYDVEDEPELIVGLAANAPIGAGPILETGFAVAGKNSKSTPEAVTMAKDVDYEIVDASRGSMRLLNTAKTYGATGEDVLSELTVTYFRAAQAAHDQVVAGGTRFEGFMRYEENNVEGDDNIWTFPTVTITPDGDLSLKGEEFRQIPYGLSVLKPPQSEAVYINGAPYGG